MGGASSRCGGEEESIHELMGKPHGRRPLGRPRSRREGNITMDLQEM